MGLPDMFQMTYYRRSALEAIKLGLTQVLDGIKLVPFMKIRALSLAMMTVLLLVSSLSETQVYGSCPQLGA